MLFFKKGVLVYSESVRFLHQSSIPMAVPRSILACPPNLLSFYFLRIVQLLLTFLFRGVGASPNTQSRIFSLRRRKMNAFGKLFIIAALPCVFPLSRGVGIGFKKGKNEYLYYLKITDF